MNADQPAAPVDAAPLPGRRTSHPAAESSPPQPIAELVVPASVIAGEPPLRVIEIPPSGSSVDDDEELSVYTFGDGHAAAVAAAVAEARTATDTAAAAGAAVAEAAVADRGWQAFDPLDDPSYEPLSHYFIEDVYDNLYDPRSQSSFPVLLHRILSHGSHRGCATWLPHGSAFAVVDREAFLAQVAAPYFCTRSLDKFMQWIRAYGFQHVRHEPSGVVIFYHKVRLLVPRSSRLNPSSRRVS